MKEMCPYEECSRELSTPYSLKRHIETCHYNVRKFACSQCDRKFSSQRNLWSHLSKHQMTPSRFPTSKLLIPPLPLPSFPPEPSPDTDFLVGHVHFPAIITVTRPASKLPLAWLLMGALNRSRVCARGK